MNGQKLMDRLVVMGASAGGIEALSTILAGLPADFPATILIAMHIGERHSLLPEVLARHCVLPVSHAEDGQVVQPGRVLIAPPYYHLLVKRDGDTLRTVLNGGPKENYYRPSIDVLFRSAASACGSRLIGVILTGYLDDGVAGLQAVKECGGYVMVQDPDDATAPDMPRNALAAVAVDRCLSLSRIAKGLIDWAATMPASGTIETAVPDWVSDENECADGKSSLALLKRLGNPSAYSCPECGGCLFTVRHAVPTRLRCHTGHSYTLQIMLEQQTALIENTLRIAVRALQEKESLAEQLAADLAGRTTAEESGFDALARQARTDAARVRNLILRQQRTAASFQDSPESKSNK